jgi:hypothetical protein
MVAWEFMVLVAFGAALVGFFVAALCHAAGDADEGKHEEEARR